MNQLRLLPRAITAAAILFAAGCSGGGGPSELTVSEQNAEALVAQGVGAVSMLEGMNDMMDGFSESIFDPAAQVTPCPDGGNAVLSVNDMAPAGLSTGDYASLDFNACRIDFGEGVFTFNGGLYLAATDISGDPLTTGGTREFYGSFDSLTLNLLGATVVVDGGISTSLSSPDGTTFTLTVSGTHFSAYANAGGQAFSGSLDDFENTRTWDSVANTYSLVVNATIYSSELGGYATFETTAPFTGLVGEHPSAGSFVATGAMGGKVTLVALDNVNVQILVDADGDGNNETTINTTWDALENNA